jgi:hypothetical protein
MGSLLILSILSVIFFIEFAITGQLHWAFYRLNYMTISVSYAFICLSSVYVTPEIYRSVRIIFGCFDRHETNYGDPNSISNITRTQRKSIYSGCRRSTSVMMVESDTDV